MATNKIGRNDLCPCHSGKKYKQCCLDKDQAARLAPKLPEAKSSPAPRSAPATAPAPRIKNADELRWEAFWARFDVAPIDQRLAMAREAIDAEPDFNGELAVELCDPIQIALSSEGRYDEIDALFGSIEAKHPKAFEEHAGWFALCRAENELCAARGRELEAMRRLGAHFVQVIDSGNHLVGRLRFHSRIDCLEALLSSALPSVRASDDVTGWAKDDVAALLTEAITARHRALTPQLAPDDSALIDELAPLLGGRDEATRAIAPWFAARERRWSLGDFARVGNEKDTSLRDVAIDFARTLESRWGFHALRAGMACTSIHQMIARGQERTKRSEWEGSRTIRVPPTKARPLAIVPPSAEAFGRAHSDFIAIHAHELAAGLLGLRHWGTFLGELGLVEETAAESAWRSFLGDVRRDLGPLLLERLEGDHDSDAVVEVGRLLSEE